MKYITGALLIGLLFVIAPTITEDLTDAEIRKLLIQQSIRSYSGRESVLERGGYVYDLETPTDYTQPGSR